MEPKTLHKRRFIQAALGLAFIAATLSPAYADGSMETPKAPPETGVWAVMAGSSLKATLERWSEVAGWTLVWDNRSDFQLRASATFQGGFEESVGALIDGIYLTNPGFSATLYRGNRVLHVQEQTLSSN